MYGVIQHEIANVADLGGSSKYSNMIFEYRVGRGSMWTVIGHGLADLKVQGCSAQISFAVTCEKGCRQTSSAWMWISSGDTRWSCDVGHCSGKRYLFFLTAVHSGISLLVGIVKLLVKHVIIRCVWCIIGYPWKSEYWVVHSWPYP